MYLQGFNNLMKRKFSINLSGTSNIESIKKKKNKT